MNFYILIYKSTRLYFLQGTFLLFIRGLIIFLSYDHRSLAALFVAVVILGIGNCCADVSLFVVVTCHTYPISETFVSMWVAGIGALVFVALAVIQRVLFNAFSLRAAIIELTVVLFVSFILSLLMKPQNKREEVQEEYQPTELNELTPILMSNQQILSSCMDLYHLFTGDD